MKIAASPHLAPAVAFTGVCTLLGIVGIASRPSLVPSSQLPSIPVADPIEPVRISAAEETKLPAPPPAPSSQLLFAFSSGGGNWVRLMDLAGPDDIDHGKRRLYNDGETATVANVTPANVPAKFRSWNGEAITVYGGNAGPCTASITGFAVVTRLVGDPGYAGLDDPKWSAETAAGAGSAVLAARIEGCGPGLFARQAKLAPIVLPTDVPVDAKLARDARAALLGSDAARDARTSFAEHHETPATTEWYDHADFITKAVRHPNGTTWVVVHAQGGHECGGFDANIIGVFKRRPDGTLVTVSVRKLDSVYAIDKLIDIDNDGTLELLGKDWLGTDEVLARPDGELIDSLGMKFHGCPC